MVLISIDSNTILNIGNGNLKRVELDFSSSIKDYKRLVIYTNNREFYIEDQKRVDLLWSYFADKAIETEAELCS